MEGLYSEYDLDLAEVRPPVPPATREAPAAKSGAGARGVRKAISRHHRSPPGGPILVVSTAAVAAVAATTAAPAVTAEIATTRGPSRACGEACAGPGGFRRALRITKRTHEVPVAGLGREHVLRGCPVGVCHENRGSQEDRSGGGRENRRSLRFTAGIAPGEGA